MREYLVRLNKHLRNTHLFHFLNKRFSFLHPTDGIPYTCLSYHSGSIQLDSECVHASSGFTNAKSLRCKYHELLSATLDGRWIYC